MTDVMPFTFNGNPDLAPSFDHNQADAPLSYSSVLFMGSVLTLNFNQQILDHSQLDTAVRVILGETHQQIGDHTGKTKTAIDNRQRPLHEAIGANVQSGYLLRCIALGILSIEPALKPIEFPLTHKQQDVLGLSALDYPNKRIVSELGISLGAVALRVRNAGEARGLHGKVLLSSAYVCTRESLDDLLVRVKKPDDGNRNASLVSGTQQRT